MAYVSGALPYGKPVRELIKRLPTPVPRPPGSIYAAVQARVKAGERPQPTPEEMVRKSPRSLYERVRAAHSGPSAPETPIDWRVVALRVRGRPVPPWVRKSLAKVERGGTLSAWEEQELQGFFKKVFKAVGKVVKPIVKIVKPFLAPLVAMIPVVGIPAAAAIKAVQTIRASAKAQQAQQAVVQDVQQAPSWATMTPAQQQAVIASIMAGQVPSVQVPPDVSAAYQRSIQYQAAAVAPVGPAMPEPPMQVAPIPEAPQAEAGIMGMGGMGTMAMIGAAGLALVVLMGGGDRRRG